MDSMAFLGLRRTEKIESTERIPRELRWEKGGLYDRFCVVLDDICIN